MACRHTNAIGILAATKVFTKGRLRYRSIMTEYANFNLSALMVSPNLNWDESHLKGVSKQLISGVAYIHSRGYVHLDLKPSNVLFTLEGVVKVADFGHARGIS
jgi:serine/threonine protein kinase